MLLSIFFCNNNTFCVNNLDLSPLIIITLTAILNDIFQFCVSKYETQHAEADEQQNTLFQDVGFGR
jgi:hypothetical protein